MFDSFESVWVAANADPKCDAYLIPIPYFDLNPDGSVGDMHYEGGMYPDYIPITDWQAYKLEERHPDIIFIHNPYDGNNKVTSVHPDYYAKKLKGFTKLLVYIPYFVCIDNISEHFCINAATLYADRVIVQSDKVRRTYIRVFKEFEKEHNCKGRFGNTEKKFIALGSPKFDATLLTKRENCKIPIEWEKFLIKPDGSYKKVVLYNTGITGLLNGKEEVLQKMENVFTFFKKRDDAVLLWRPHPLNESTCTAMKPQFLKEYLSLAENYKRQNCGIYDDTTDLHRAIAVSDAYYGDWSSLVALFQFAGKPVIIQNHYCICSEGTFFRDLHYDGEYFWLTDIDFGFLYKMKKETAQVEYVCSFLNESSEIKCFGSILEYEHKLYFTPESIDGIGIYNKIEKTFNIINIKEPRQGVFCNYSPYCKFRSSVRYRDFLFLIPLTYPAIVRYNLLTEEVDYFSDWLVPLSILITHSDEPYFTRGVNVTDNKITLAAANANAVVIFNMDTLESRVYEVGSRICRYHSICFDGKDYWLSPYMNKKIIRWNPNMLTFTEYDKLPNKLISRKMSFCAWSIKYAGDYVYLFPLIRDNTSFKINIKNGECSVAEEFQTDYVTEIYTFSEAIDDSIYAYAAKSGLLIEYNYKTKKRKDIPFCLTGKCKETALSLFVEKYIINTKECKTVSDCFYHEKLYTSLSHFIELICEHNFNKKIADINNKQIEMRKDISARLSADSGKVIYKHCKSELMNNAYKGE